MTAAPTWRCPRGIGALAAVVATGVASAAAGEPAAGPGTVASCAWAAAATSALWAALLWRFTRAARRDRRAREARARECELGAWVSHDALLQGTQGLVLNLQVVVNEFPRGDPRRERLEALLDEADGVLARARDRMPGWRDDAR